MDSKEKEQSLKLAEHYFREKNYSYATHILEKIIKIDSSNSKANELLAYIYGNAGQFDVCFEFLNVACSQNDCSTEALYYFGSIQLKRGHFGHAIETFKKSIFKGGEFFEALHDLATAQAHIGDLKSAINNYQKCLKLRNLSHELFYNIARIYYDLKRYEEAITHYDKALSLKPNFAEAWCNKGNTLHELKRFDEAITHYDKALSLKPDYHEASWNKGLALLLQGDFAIGLQLYESRLVSERVDEISGKRIFDKPTWLGVDSLVGKTILIYGEQGLGDFIQFCRYVKLVADLGAQVILETPQALASLMGSLEGVSELVIKGEGLPFFDYQCPLLSLPLAFHTNTASIPADIPYLSSSSNKVTEWKLRLGEKTKKRIGLVWSGNPHHKNDHNRSILLRDILPFLPNQFEYVSLQKEVREIDKLTLDSNLHILDFASHLNDFLDTAALIDNLDLVISVDTSVAHLSGALGKKTLLMLPYVPDWRWLLDRDDSLWYPSVKIYRQPDIGDWDSVFDRIKLDLCSYLL